MKRILLYFGIAMFGVVGCGHGRKVVPASAPAAAEAPWTLVCPAQGGARWIEVSSAHFSLRTDVSTEKARKKIESFEAAYAALAGVARLFLPAAQPAGQMDIVLLARGQDMAAIDQHAGGFFRDMGERRRPLIVLQDMDEAWGAIQHELAHQLITQRLVHIPIWLNEGLAEYLSTVAIADGKARVGQPIWQARYLTPARLKPRSGYWTSLTQLPSFREILERRPQAYVDPRRSGAFYVAAWALIHYLANGEEDHRERFRALLADIANGRPAAAALPERYGGLKKLEARYDGYVRRMAETMTQLRVWTVPCSTKPAVVQLVERDLDEGEIHALWGSLRSKRQRPELEALRAHAPNSPFIHWMLAWSAEREHRTSDAEHEIAQAVALAPESHLFRVDQLEMRLSREGVKPEPDRQRLAALAEDAHALAREAHDWNTLNDVAWYYALVGDYEFGLPFAVRSVAAQPSCAACWDTLALLYFHKGEIELAIEAQEAAIARWPERVPVPAQVLQRMAQYRTASRTSPKRDSSADKAK